MAASQKTVTHVRSALRNPKQTSYQLAYATLSRNRTTHHTAEKYHVNTKNL